MKKLIYGLMILFVFLLSLNFVSAENTVTMHIFEGAGCPHCAELLEFLDSIKDDYPNLEIIEYEIRFDQDNRELFERMSGAYDVKVQGVPTTFIDEKVYFGFGESLKEVLINDIERCSVEQCVNPIEKLNDLEEPDNREITIPAVILAALVDAINPCAFAVLIILLTTILASGIRKRALYAGLAFTSSIFISYFFMGLGLYSAISASGVSRIFFIGIAILAILIGLFNLKDYLWYGKWFIMEVPLSWRPKMKTLLKSITSIPGAFVTGFLISLFLLPCTSGPYIVILGMLSELATRNHALLLLILYNLIFILPMLLITLAISFGFTTTEQAEEWRKRRLKTLHLISGVIMLLLGIGMLLGVTFGLI